MLHPTIPKTYRRICPPHERWPKPPSRPMPYLRCNFTTTHKGPSSMRSSNNFRPNLEILEDRTTPTVIGAIGQSSVLVTLSGPAPSITSSSSSVPNPIALSHPPPAGIAPQAVVAIDTFTEYTHLLDAIATFVV